jgi:hypothetical protein
MAHIASVTALHPGACMKTRLALTADERTLMDTLLERARSCEHRWVLSERTDLRAYSDWQRAQMAMNAAGELVLWRVLELELPARLRVLRNGEFTRLTVHEVHVEPHERVSDALLWYAAGLEHDEFGRETRIVRRVRIDDACVWTDRAPRLVEAAQLPRPVQSLALRA